MIQQLTEVGAGAILVSVGVTLVLVLGSLGVVVEQVKLVHHSLLRVNFDGISIRLSPDYRQFLAV